MWSNVFLGICGMSFGLIASAGVFTVLISVGLIPRFAGKTHTAHCIFFYENTVVLGTILGGLVSVFPIGNGLVPLEWLKNGFLIIYGIFSGIFVGCLALAIAEMLDAVPIFVRRIKFRKGIGIAILSVALGKLTGSLIYFINQMAP